MKTCDICQNISDYSNRISRSYSIIFFNIYSQNVASPPKLYCYTILSPTNFDLHPDYATFDWNKNSRNVWF